MVIDKLKGLVTTPADSIPNWITSGYYFAKVYGKPTGVRGGVAIVRCKDTSGLLLVAKKSNLSFEAFYKQSQV